MAKNLFKRIFTRNENKEPSMSWEDFHPLTENGFCVLATTAGINVDDYWHLKKLNEGWKKYQQAMAKIIALEIMEDGKQMVDRLVEVINKDRQDPFTEADVIEIHQKPKTQLYYYSKNATENKIRSDTKYGDYSDEEIKQLYLDDLVEFANNGVKGNLTNYGFTRVDYEPPKLKLTKDEVENTCGVIGNKQDEKPDYSKFQKPDKVERLSGNYRLDKHRVIVREYWNIALKTFEMDALEGENSLLNTMGNLIVDYKRIDLGRTPTRIRKEEYKKYGGTKWTSLNKAYNESVGSAIKDRYQALFDETRLRDEQVIKEFESSLGLIRIGIFYQHITDAIISIENNRLFRENSDRKR